MAEEHAAAYIESAEEFQETLASNAVVVRSRGTSVLAVSKLNPSSCVCACTGTRAGSGTCSCRSRVQRG